MPDRDSAELYQVETRTLNQAIKRNMERFPNNFMFQLNNEEVEFWKSQIVMSNSIKQGLRRNPYVFTEQGVTMLSAVLRSPIAIQVNINIMEAFIAMCRYLTAATGQNKEIAQVKKINQTLAELSANSKTMPEHNPRKKIGFKK